MVYKNYPVTCAPFAGLWSASHTLLSLYLRSTMLPFEIRVTAPIWFNDYAARSFLAAFSNCTFLCRRTTLNVYLRHQAFRSEQSRHGWKAINSFSLWLRTRSMSKCASRKRAATRIEQYCKRRKDRMKPKWQEDSSCVFAYYFCRGTCHRRDTAEKERAPKSLRRRSGKEVL